MSVRIRHIPLDQISPGTALGEAIRDGQGDVLLMAGTQLTEAHLTSLHRRGVCSVPIAEQETMSEQALEAPQPAMHARLQHIFRHCLSEPERQLYQIILEYRMGQL